MRASCSQRAARRGARGARRARGRLRRRARSARSRESPAQSGAPSRRPARARPRRRPLAPRHDRPRRGEQPVVGERRDLIDSMREASYRRRRPVPIDERRSRAGVRRPERATKRSTIPPRLAEAEGYSPSRREAPVCGRAGRSLAYVEPTARPRRARHASPTCTRLPRPSAGVPERGAAPACRAGTGPPSPCPTHDARARCAAAAAALAREQRQDEAAAAYEQVLASDPLDREAFAFLDALLPPRQQHAQRAPLLERSAALAGAAAARARRAPARSRQHLRGAAQGHATPRSAASACSRELDPESDDALRALKRLLERAERWDELARVIEAELARAARGREQAAAAQAPGSRCTASGAGTARRPPMRSSAC